MIKAFLAGYIKYDHEHTKRHGPYLILEMSIAQFSHIKLMILNESGLVSTHLLDSITTIPGYHRYTSLNNHHLGAGNLKSLSTRDPKGMLEGLSKQMNWDYTSLATGFGQGLLELTKENE